jgi:hypothetical protein
LSYAIDEREIEKLFITAFDELASHRAKNAAPGEQNYNGQYVRQEAPNLFNAFNHYTGSSVSVNNYAQAGVEVTRQLIL